ncbi:glycosyltransferase family 8 protein [Horticoccus luteus]|uniref:Glycosyltransferase family 8 protein n=1 Tax=Horticoccus luteus TaxID=2862869 RepID=A0A8F9XFG5_9BACT|nr:glycosyltransferase family 8 protein [Horticoccus luteus]QYM78067.1 glycosyltransferase family 8 protein [Horticoccus luteus]
MSSRHVDIAFCCDEGYLQPLTVAVESLVATASQPSALRVWVASRSLQPEMLGHLANRVESLGGEFHVVPIATDDARLRGAKVDKHLSVATYDRLLLPDVLPAEVTRVLYLDCDIVVCRAVEELWAEDLGAHSLAAVQKPRAENFARVGLACEEDYFNAGVLLMDLARWRAERTHLTALAYIQQEEGRLEFHDQDALNHAIAGRWTHLDRRWNQQFKFFVHTAGFLHMTAADLRRVRTDPFLVHFTTGSKPWHYDNAHPFRHYFYAALDRTIYAGWRPQPRDWRERVHRWRCACVPPHLDPAVLRNVFRPGYKALKARLRLRVALAGTRG